MQPGIQGALSGSLTGSIPIGSSIKFKGLPRVVRPFLIPMISRESVVSLPENGFCAIINPLINLPIIRCCGSILYVDISALADGLREH